MQHLNLPCCPQLENFPCCDHMDLKYTLMHRVQVNVRGRKLVVPVEVTIHSRIERCPGPLALGDLVYTTTLLPGEKVRLVTTDRRSRFSFDSQTKMSYRHAQSSEESYYMTSFAREMSDLNVSEWDESKKHAWGNWQGSADATYDIGFMGMSGDMGGSISGSYDDQSTRSFMSSLSKHAESSHYRSERMTRTASSVSVGEVATRTHTEGESEDSFESLSRVFSNSNRCHAITYLFYRINKLQKMSFHIVDIDRNVLDLAAPTRIQSNPAPMITGVSVIPGVIHGTDTNRLEIENKARESTALQTSFQQKLTASIQQGGRSSLARTSMGDSPSLAIQIEEPFPTGARMAALKQVDEGLLSAGLIDKIGGKVNPTTATEFSWERQSCLPTPGIIVRGCLDDCNVCEKELMLEMELDLERKKLENEKLKKEIELLEKSQEYRCCPQGTTETTPP